MLAADDFTVLSFFQEFIDRVHASEERSCQRRHHHRQGHHHLRSSPRPAQHHRSSARMTRTKGMHCWLRSEMDLSWRRRSLWIKVVLWSPVGVAPKFSKNKRPWRSSSLCNMCLPPSGKTSSVSSSSGSAPNSASSAVPNGGGPMGLGALFAGGMPKLRPTGQRTGAAGK